MIFIDSNIPMYLIGADHPNKEVARRLTETVVERGERLVTDAEVYQEILHRYVAINRRSAIGPAFELLDELVDETFAIDRDASERARRLLEGERRLSARDALHVAVMQREGIARVMTFDLAFDLMPGIQRLEMP